MQKVFTSRPKYFQRVTYSILSLLLLGTTILYLSSYKWITVFADGKTVRVCAASAGAMRPMILALLNQFDKAYPFYGTLPNDKDFEKFGLAGKTVTRAPAKKVFRPTLLEMLRSNKIK